MFINLFVTEKALSFNYISPKRKQMEIKTSSNNSSKEKTITQKVPTARGFMQKIKMTTIKNVSNHNALKRNNMGKNTDSNKVLLSVHFPCVHLVLDAAGYGGEGGELVGRHLAVHPSQVGQQGRLTHGWEA